MVDLIFTGFNATDLALAIPRIGAGVFFAISGGHKLFNQARHAGLVQTLKQDKVPAVGFMQWWVPGWEFTAGLALAVGLASCLSAAVLLIIMCVACFLEAGQRVEEYKPIDRLDRLDDYLYLPEVLYVLLLLVTLLAGPGCFSLDHLLWG